MKDLIAILSVLWLALQAGMAMAAPPPYIAAEVPEARLAGAGTYRWFGIHIYDAELWVGPKGYGSHDAAFALDLRYARAFEGKKIASRSIDEIEKLGFGNEVRRRAWLAQMQVCFPNVEDGTHLTGVFLPDIGVRYYHNGKAICDIRDKEFASAFFAIWLDPRTAAQALRAALLGPNWNAAMTPSAAK